MEDFKLDKIDENSIINKVCDRKPLEFKNVDSLLSKEYEKKMKKAFEKRTKRTLQCGENKEEFIVLH